VCAENQQPLSRELTSKEPKQSARAVCIKVRDERSTPNEIEFRSERQFLKVVRRLRGHRSESFRTKADGIGLQVTRGDPRLRKAMY
jgi:hypothetical protein